ncbi:hypothetical protein ACU4GA_26140 [Methylobacterium oryzae CBMB20]
MEDLIRGLRRGFADFGVPGDLRLSVSSGGTYYCHSAAYNIWANTGHPAGSIAPETLLEREYGRLAHPGSARCWTTSPTVPKILVRKVGRDEPEADFARLAEAVWAHGPSTLLRVTEAGPRWAAEPARRVADRLIEGRVRRFAPVEQAWAVDLEPWMHLVDSAYALERGAAPTRLDAAAFPEALTLPGRLRRHVGRHRAAALSAYTRAVDPAGFRADTVHVFSSWVWIPEDFAGDRVFAAAGYARLGWRDADLSRRRCWQRVWAAGRLRPDATREPVGLGMIGTRRDGFWSAGARFAEGPIPGDEPAPELRMPPVRFPGRDLLGRLLPRVL